MFKMISASLLFCIIYPPYISTALAPSRFNLGAHFINPHPLQVNPATDLSSQSNPEADVAASTIQPTLPSDIPTADTVSSPANATASSSPNIALDNTILENPALLDEDNAVRANIISDYETYCWSSRQIHPIQRPVDCYEAINLIYRDGPALEEVTWSGPRSWVSGSCMLLLVPNKASAEDVFIRLDIISAANQIQHECINLEHGFRGGHTGIGPLNEFHVSVEAK